jgi:hypothetical protein
MNGMAQRTSTPFSRTVSGGDAVHASATASYA